MMIVPPQASPIQFGKAASPAEVQTLARQYGDEAVNPALVFSYDAPRSRGLFGLGKKLAAPEELLADSQALKGGIRTTPQQDVFLLLAQESPNPNKVRKQVIKHFVTPFNKSTGGLMGRVLSKLTGIKLKSEAIGVKSLPGQNLTLVRVPFQKSPFEQIGDIATGLVEALDEGMKSTPRPPRSPFL